MLSEKSIDLSYYRIKNAENKLYFSKLALDHEGYKNSISDSYYCIFNAIRSILALEDKDFKKHSYVISYFQKEYLKSNIFDRKYSDIIKNAFKCRNLSDYEDFYIAFRSDAEEQYNNAKEFLEAVKTYLEKRINEEKENKN